MDRKTTAAILIVAIIGISYFFATLFFDEGSYFNPNTKTHKADVTWRMEAEDTDLRVYEFTPQTNKNKQCVFVAGTGKGSLHCWDK